MNKCYLFLLSLLAFICSGPIWAAIDSLEPLLNKVTLQLHAEQWVTTKTALVNVGINAAVAGQGIEKVRSEVIDKLNQLAPSNDWHILSFNRQLDKSGLESIQMSAQARLQQSDLNNLRDKAKTISKPGETYTIDSIQFTPSEDELRQANSTLRNDIYQQAKAELDTLNKTYPDQKYYIHQIEFLVFPPPPVPMMAAAAEFPVKSAYNRALPLNVGNKNELQATIVLASMPVEVAKAIQTK